MALGSGRRLRAGEVGAVTACFALTVLYTAYGTPLPDPAVLFVVPLFLAVAGFLVGLPWLVVRWLSSVRTLRRERRVTTTAMLAGLLLAVSSYFNEGVACVLCVNTTGAQPWRHPEFAVRTLAGPFGFEVPALVLDSSVQCFCPQTLALPHLLGGVALVGAAALADRRLRAW